MTQTSDNGGLGRLLLKLLMEIGFFLAVVLAVVLTVADIFVGIVRYLWGRLVQQRPNFNPWQQTMNVWRMIGKHIVYLFKMFNSGFREEMRSKRKAMHARARLVRDSVRGSVGEDFDYVDAVAFFTLVPYMVVSAVFLWQAIVAAVIVFSGYHVYKQVQTTPTLHKTPQPVTKVEYQPQVADQQETDFGPWLNRGQVFDKVNKPDFKNLVMISDTGSLTYSEKTVSEAGFQQLDFNERVVNPRVLKPSGQIAFTDQLGQGYAINPGQAFLFAGYQSKMFMFNAQGQLLAIDPTKAKFQAQASH